MKIRDDNGKTLISTFYNLLFSPDLCDKLFYIIMLMNVEHTCLFIKGFSFLSANQNNAVTLPHSVHRKHEVLVKTKEKSKSKTESIPKKSISLESLHQKLGHRSTSSLLAGYTSNVWKDI